MRENIVIQLIARDDEISFEEASKMWEAWKKAALDGHSGDCTNEPQTCAVCLVERMYKDADQILALFENWFKQEVEKLEVVKSNPYFNVWEIGYIERKAAFENGTKAQLQTDKDRLLKLFCEHDYEPTFQGGDTYKCLKCGDEIDMTED